jgi:inorganic triphosphatase YgiF
MLYLLNFTDEVAARLAYDEILNLSDNGDVNLDGLAIRTVGPAGRIRVEVPEQLVAGSASASQEQDLADFLTQVLSSSEPPNTVLSTGAAVIAVKASDLESRRFRSAMSIFDGVTITRFAEDGD